MIAEPPLCSGLHEASGTRKHREEGSQNPGNSRRRHLGREAYQRHFDFPIFAQSNELKELLPASLTSKFHLSKLGG